MINIVKCGTLLFSISKVWGVWICLHSAFSYLYTTHCAGTDMYTIILSPITSQTPPCKGILWVINAASFSIENMWIVLGGWCCLQFKQQLGYNPTLRSTS